MIDRQVRVRLKGTGTVRAVDREYRKGDVLQLDRETAIKFVDAGIAEPAWAAAAQKPENKKPGE